MSSAVKSVFGGSDDSAQKSQQSANKRSQAFIEEQAKLARGDALDLFPSAEKNILAGNQAALDALAGFYPQQYGAVQGGLDAARAAILGTGQGQSDFEPNLAFLQQVLPSLRPEGLRYGVASSVEGSPVYSKEAAALAAKGLNPSLPMLPEELARALQGGGIGAMSPYVPTNGQPPVSVQPPAEVLPQWMQGLKTNEDFIRAASQGLVPNVSKGDQSWFGEWLADATRRQPGLLSSSGYITDPTSARSQIMGQTGGLTARNTQRVANALQQMINRTQASSTGTSGGITQPANKFI